MKWHPLFHTFIRRLYFSRVTVTGQENVPATGPVLAICLHRNGAVDGFVYRGALPRVAYMVKATLRRSLMGKVFFDGVEVARSEDGGSGGNQGAIEECVLWLARGGWLAIFPEGTSGLGPRHLPFKSGAARIALRHLESGQPLTVLPLGIHYECPWTFRSRVEVVIGPPVPLTLPDDLTSPGARLQEVKRRFTGALEAAGLNVPDAGWQDLAEKFACIATLGTSHRYFDALKVMERQLPEQAVSAWRALEEKSAGRSVLRHQGVPLFPLRLPWAYVVLTLLPAVPVAAGALVNLPPLAVAWWAGLKFPDDRNVIALWRILTGVPLLIVWAAAWCAAGLITGLWWLPLCYFILTWISVRGWYRLKKLTVVAWNGLFHARLRPDALAVHQAVLAAVESSSRE